MKIVCIDRVYASVNKLLKWAASVSAGLLKAKRNKNGGRCQVSHVPKAGTRLPLQDRWGGWKTDFAITNTPPLSEGTRPGGGFLGKGWGWLCSVGSHSLSHGGVEGGFPSPKASSDQLLRAWCVTSTRIRPKQASPAPRCHAGCRPHCRTPLTESIHYK